MLLEFISLQLSSTSKIEQIFFGAENFPIRSSVSIKIFLAWHSHVTVGIFLLRLAPKCFVPLATAVCLVMIVVLSLSLSQLGFSGSFVVAAAVDVVVALVVVVFGMFPPVSATPTRPQSCLFWSWCLRRNVCAETVGESMKQRRWNKLNNSEFCCCCCCWH